MLWTSKNVGRACPLSERSGHQAHDGGPGGLRLVTRSGQSRSMDAIAAQS
jgi:hypothetical protein